MSVDYRTTVGFGFAVPESLLPEHEDGTWESAEQLCGESEHLTFTFVGSAYDSLEDTVLILAKGTARTLDSNYDRYKEFSVKVSEDELEELVTAYWRLNGRHPDEHDLTWVVGGYWR